MAGTGVRKCELVVVRVGQANVDHLINMAEGKEPFTPCQTGCPPVAPVEVVNGNWLAVHGQVEPKTHWPAELATMMLWFSVREVHASVYGRFPPEPNW
jgi:hypothetical protein